MFFEIKYLNKMYCPKTSRYISLKSYQEAGLALNQVL